MENIKSQEDFDSLRIHLIKKRSQYETLIPQEKLDGDLNYLFYYHERCIRVKDFSKAESISKLIKYLKDKSTTSQLFTN
jgi:hypothetical protein